MSFALTVVMNETRNLLPTYSIRNADGYYKSHSLEFYIPSSETEQNEAEMRRQFN